MAVVYRAKQVSLDRWVALEVLDAESADDGFHERFRSEGPSCRGADRPMARPSASSADLA
ncbi:MAG TPA: hypothetical protein VHZ31_05645 [Solirubrobacteraceae bacterium]|jgi:hypothetical protein|nr:hypothetical protein [Solirubrobacteraceae bacterium]